VKQTICILILFVTGPLLYGQTNQGYVDYDKVVVTLPQYVTGQRVLEMRKKQLSDSIELMLKVFMHKLRDTPHDVKIDSATKALLENELIQFQSKITDSQNYAQNELKKTKTKIDLDLKVVVDNEMKMYCTTKNIICVADRKSILYCNDCMDFTQDFINYLKSKAGK
jgi:Skp family chaperone for outer membrane proteins